MQALITGAGSGIGRAAALLLAGENMDIAILDINRNKAEQTKTAVEERNGRAVVLEADLASPEEMKQAFDMLRASYKHLDIVVANGGIAGTMAPIESLEPKDWDRTIETDLRGTFLTVKYAVPFMKQQGGSIVITSSVSGNRTFSQPGFSAYSTAKAGQIAFMKMAARELAPWNIRVNAVCPGGVRTEFKNSLHRTGDLSDAGASRKTDLNTFPPADAEQVAGLIQFLASGAASHITGSDIYIDGGSSLT
ncbi:NAD(P)-dependent dehydrogenase, short-chain alcohol dehydrogenase family [Salibacterium qingdaonense]|uniref:NAD(P)-dependent dehydrogenase, short-chain alcohol dehydrogenase family n=2 Tax=Salibacterium qingdaonense TaxID=266892 RepID=A0A1I4I231_9BACI|nr:NAD(P)-dependent dehydrogenase, short-chain alcohol dehydrogenase family [Salibacterium qingdaonense]